MKNNSQQKNQSSFKKKLDWEPKISIKEMISEMVKSDIENIKKYSNGNQL